jgi:hypothetical protein
MPDFWRHSGFHLTVPADNGERAVTDDLLRAFCARPEVAPIDTSCARERALFAALQEDPRRAIDAATLSSLEDADARDNYRIVLRFRDHLTRAGTVERAYAALFVDAGGAARDFAALGLPPLFADQLAHIAVRAALEPCEDGLVARAAELFFRAQIAHVEDGRALLADEETVRLDARADDGRYGNLGRLIQDAQTPLKRIELDVLTRDNASLYWARDERHDTVLPVHFGQDGLAALCRVVEAWTARFHGVATRVAPVRSIERARLRWYAGLDREATRVLNGIYNGAVQSTAEAARLLALLEMRVTGGDGALADESIHLGLAMDQDSGVRVKPQNLLLNLPFRRSA